VGKEKNTTEKKMSKTRDTVREKEKKGVNEPSVREGGDYERMLAQEARTGFGWRLAEGRAGIKCYRQHLIEKRQMDQAPASGKKRYSSFKKGKARCEDERNHSWGQTASMGKNSPEQEKSRD